MMPMIPFRLTTGSGPKCCWRLLLVVASLEMAFASPVHAEDTPPRLTVQPVQNGDAETVTDQKAMSRFLDRLMAAESGGRDDARNPRSTALGPYQFIESTFLDVARRHFAAETANLSIAAALALRTNRSFARRAAEAYSRDNASHLAGAGLAPTFANLRLAFLVGPAGAVSLLKAPPTTAAIAVLGARVVQANPFMAGMTAKDLAEWSHRNLASAGLGQTRVAVAAGRPSPVAASVRPQLNVRCERALPSCRKWIALAQKRQGMRQASAVGRRSPGR